MNFAQRAQELGGDLGPGAHDPAGDAPDGDTPDFDAPDLDAPDFDAVEAAVGDAHKLLDDMAAELDGLRP